MRRLLCFLALAVAASQAGAATSQVYGGALQALPLYGQLATAREASLGDAFHAVARGEDALFANPAGLSDLQGPDVGLDHESWVGGIDEEAVEGCLPLAPGVGLGAFGVMVNYGSFDLRDAEGLKTGDAVVQDYGVGLGVGVRTGHGLSGGLSLRGVRQDLVTDSVLGLGIDTGMTWQGGGWTTGVSLLGLRLMDGSAGGNGLRGAVSRRWDSGVGWIWPALAFDWEGNGLARVQGGLDLRLNPALDLRIGFQQATNDTLNGGLQGLTMGLGFKVGGLALDYAYLPQGDLGGGHRVSLCWRPWQTQAPPAEAPAPRPTPTPLPQPSPAALPTPAPPYPAILALPPALPPLPVPSPTVTPGLGFAEDPMVWARQMEAQGRLGEALAEYERLTRLHPDLLGAWRGVADIAYRLGLKPKALAAYRQVMALAPDPDLEQWLRDYEQEDSSAPK
jgi:hypothetical protein